MDQESDPKALAKADGNEALQHDGHDTINTDGRREGNWESRYPKTVWRNIWFEAGFVFLLLGITYVALVLNWRGDIQAVLTKGCASCDPQKLTQYVYLYLGGQFGGILFGLKYLYKVVSRGFWNQDRQVWRYLSPFLSGGVAFAIGVLIDSGILGLSLLGNAGTKYFAIGFIAGYFADSAVAKMQEIANTVFGSPDEKSGDR